MLQDTLDLLYNRLVPYHAATKGQSRPKPRTIYHGGGPLYATDLTMVLATSAIDTTSFSAKRTTSTPLP